VVLTILKNVGKNGKDYPIYSPTSIEIVIVFPNIWRIAPSAASRPGSRTPATRADLELRWEAEKAKRPLSISSPSPF